MRGGPCAAFSSLETYISYLVERLFGALIRLSSTADDDATTMTVEFVEIRGECVRPRNEEEIK